MGMFDDVVCKYPLPDGNPRYYGANATSGPLEPRLAYGREL